MVCHQAGHTELSFITRSNHTVNYPLSTPPPFSLKQPNNRCDVCILQSLNLASSFEHVEQLICSQEVTRHFDCVFRCLSLLCHYTCYDKAGHTGWGLGWGGEIRNVALVPFHLSTKRSTVRPLQAPPIGQSNAT